MQEEFEAYLKCGRLEEGFLRVRCEGCHAEKRVAFSCKKRGLCPSCGVRRMAETSGRLREHGSAWTGGLNFLSAELGRYYLAYRRLVHHWRATLPAHAYLEVHYEAIVKNLEVEARRMLEFLSLTWQEGVMNFFRSDFPSSTASAVQVRQPVYTTSVGKWRRYREQFAPLARRLEQEIPDLDAPD